MVTTPFHCSDAPMPRPASGRSEILRIAVPDRAWARFEELRDQLRTESPESRFGPGDTGTRQVLTTWLELMLREEFPGPEGLDEPEST